MRCLSLAERLRDDGAEVAFICRELPGNLCDYVSEQGFAVHRLSALTPLDRSWLHDGRQAGRLKHAEWLGVTQDVDAAQTIATLGQLGIRPAWLVVDHYGVDAAWERQLRPCTRQIMVIDDLADRQHDCEILLDQNLHQGMDSRYTGLTPAACKVLLGPKFALLRDEFRVFREKGHLRNGKIRRILVTFGGADQPNMTSVTLDAITKLNRPEISVDVVIGAYSVHREEITRKCAQLSNVTLHVQARNIAELMSAADIAIGAGGTTTWERCAVGLPAVMVSLADNQISICESVAAHHAAIYMGESSTVGEGRFLEVLRQLLNSPQSLAHTGQMAAMLVDARGLERVVDVMAG